MTSDPFTRLEKIQHTFAAKQAGNKCNPEVQGAYLAIAFYSRPLHFIVDLRDCVEVINVGTIYPIPGTQPWLIGATSRRQEIVTIIDIKAFFLGEFTRIDNNSRIIIFEYENELHGFVVEGIEGMKRLAREPTMHSDDSVIKDKSFLLKHVMRVDNKDYIFLALPELATFSVLQEQERASG